MRKAKMFMLAAGLASTLTMTAAAQQAAKGNDTVVTVAGQKVAVDPATGKLRQPTAEESRKLAEAMKKYVNHSTEGLTVKTHANGMKSVDLQGRFHNAAVGKRNAAGTVSTNCATNENEVEHAVHGKQKKQAEVK